MAGKKQEGFDIPTIKKPFRVHRVSPHHVLVSDYEPPYHVVMYNLQDNTLAWSHTYSEIVHGLTTDDLGRIWLSGFNDKTCTVLNEDGSYIHIYILHNPYFLSQ